MRTVVPPIKSQGIKTKLVPWIKELVPPYKGCWIEPFLGTGVVAFNMANQSALLCDTNPHVIRFYQAVKAGEITPEKVRQYLRTEGDLLSEAEEGGYVHFRKVRDRFNKQFDPLDLLFLSRAGFNGMMRFNRKGEWNIPFCQKPNRFSQAYITKIANQVTNVASRIQKDWRFEIQGFESTISEAGIEDMIYCDPPYIGRYADYYNGWTELDERRLFALLSETKARFVLSTWHHNDYRQNVFIGELWSRFNIVTRDHFYHSGAKIENRKSVVEALVFNFDANIQVHNHGVAVRSEQLSLMIDA